MDQENAGSNSNFPDANSKRKKPDKKDDTEAVSDRLSELPEPLLVHIISLLDMKDAVKTGVLSKMWKNLWTQVDSIVIFHEIASHQEEEAPTFFSFVDNVLMHCNCPNIKKFHLCFFYDGPGKEIVLKWIQCVFKKNVEFLKLEVLNVFGEFPEWFYHNSSLVKLKIDAMDIPGSHVVSWTSLKSLSLSDLLINDEQIAQILSGSPVLETLILKVVKFVTRLEVISPSLKTLKLIDFEAKEINDALEINAPRLHQLEISGFFFGFNCRLLDVSSLNNVDLSFRHLEDFYFDGKNDVQWFTVVTKLLQDVQNVKELTIGPVLIQALSVLKLLGKPLPLFNCKHLTACLPILEYDMPGMASLLQSSRHLDTLSIKVVKGCKYYFSSYFNKISDANEDEFLTLSKWNFQHLKRVEVVYTCKTSRPWKEDESSHKKCFDYELVEYLLRNTNSLEKLVITSEKGGFWCSCAGFCAPRDALLFSRRAFDLSLNNRAQWKFTRKQSVYEFTYS